MDLRSHHRLNRNEHHVANESQSEYAYHGRLTVQTQKDSDLPHSYAEDSRNISCEALKK